MKTKSDALQVLKEWVNIPKFKLVIDSRLSKWTMAGNGPLQLQLHGRMMLDSVGKRHPCIIVSKTERPNEQSEPSRTWWWWWCGPTTYLKHSGHLQWRQWCLQKMSYPMLKTRYHTVCSTIKTPIDPLAYSGHLGALLGCIYPSWKGESWMILPSLPTLLDTAKSTRDGNLSHINTILPSSGQMPQGSWRTSLGKIVWMHNHFKK